MNYDKTDSRPRLRTLIIALLIGLSPVATGLVVINWQLAKQLENDAQGAAKEALDLIEGVIRPIAEITDTTMSIAGKACVLALPQLREQVVNVVNLRSLLLVSDNNIYCSSLLGAIDRRLNPGDFYNRTLWLRAGNEVTPDRAVLYYRTYEHPYGVVSLIDGSTLRNKLATIKTEGELALEFGPAFMKSDGQIYSTQAPGHEEFHQRLVSQNYGFAVHSGFPQDTHWRTFKNRATTTSSSLLLVGLLTGGAVYWVMAKPRPARYRRPEDGDSWS
jgi:hypothetical protein